MLRFCTGPHTGSKKASARLTSFFERSARHRALQLFMRPIGALRHGLLDSPPKGTQRYQALGRVLLTCRLWIHVFLNELAPSTTIDGNCRRRGRRRKREEETIHSERRGAPNVIPRGRRRRSCHSSFTSTWTSRYPQLGSRYLSGGVPVCRHVGSANIHWRPASFVSRKVVR